MYFNVFHIEAHSNCNFDYLEISPHIALQLKPVPKGTTVSMYFNVFHIEAHSNCNFDYLEVSPHISL